MRGVLFQDGVQQLQEKIRVTFRKYQWRAKLDDVVMRSVSASEYAAIAKAIYHIGGLRRSCLSRFTVQHEIDPQEKSQATHIADQCVAVLQGLQAPDEMGADAQSILL